MNDFTLMFSLPSKHSHSSQIIFVMKVTNFVKSAKTSFLTPSPRPKMHESASHHFPALTGAGGKPSTCGTPLFRKKGEVRCEALPQNLLASTNDLCQYRKFSIIMIFFANQGIRIVILIIFLRFTRL